MCRKDMPTILKIENESFENPWEDAAFTAALTQRNVIGSVAEIDSEVVGYVVYSLNKRNLEIVNLATAVEHRFEGVGKTIIERLKHKLTPQRQSLNVLVRETNLDCQLFLRSCGLLATGIRRGFYDDTREDAFLFRVGLEAESNAMA
jgi:ribosomal-protein-alanine N-acetyltransferase